MASDDDKTVFGQNLPPPGGGGQTPGRRNIAPTRPMPKGGSGGGAAPDRTVVGGVPPQQPVPQQPPPQQAPPPQYAPPPGQSPTYNPTGRAAPTGQPGSLHEDTWLSGNFDPSPQQQPQGYPQQTYNQTPQYNPQGYQPHAVRPQGTGGELFPEIPQKQDEVFRREVPRISLQDALKTTGIDKSGSTNPLVAAAANLLILLGRLRTGLVEMQSQILIEHVAREIDTFERAAFERNVSPQDVEDGKYALCATADDIVQNLPGADRGQWLQYGMCARFFQDRSSGVNFFIRLDGAMKAPGQRFNVLELMLICMSLGFEGQYRAGGNGGLELNRVRGALYETLRRVQPRADDDISVRWLGVPLGGRRTGSGIPAWILASIAGAMVVTLFITLAALLNFQASDAQERLLGLHRLENLDELTLVRDIPPEVEPPPDRVVFVAPQTDQFADLETFLQPEIADGSITEIGRYNDFIYVRLGDVLQFRSGSAQLDSDFEPLAQRLAEAANTQTGQILVVGHTDSVGSEANNLALSIARAETVRGVMAPFLDDASRLTAEGRGEVEPIASNDDPTGRAENRRVEILFEKASATAGVDTPLEGEDAEGDQ